LLDSIDNTIEADSILYHGTSGIGRTAAVAASRSEASDFTLSNHPTNGKTVPKGVIGKVVN